MLETWRMFCSQKLLELSSATMLFTRGTTKPMPDAREMRGTEEAENCASRAYWGESDSTQELSANFLWSPYLAHCFESSKKYFNGSDKWLTAHVCASQ